MVPAPFRSLRVLRVLNVTAVGWALASVTSAVFAHVLAGVSVAALATAVPTWVLGTLWAVLMRWPKAVDKHSFRWGWVASGPLALLDAAVAFGMIMTSERPRAFPAEVCPSDMVCIGGLCKSPCDGVSFFGGAILGATAGAVYWIPALALTVICFGLPITLAKKHARKGLSGEERGERIVGLAALTMSTAGIILSSAFGPDPANGYLWVPLLFGILGALAAGSATVLAQAREARRRAFVARAEAGAIPGYRVDPTEEGKVLIRAVSPGEGYRVADFEEEVFDLDAAGEATRPRAMRA